MPRLVSPHLLLFLLNCVQGDPPVLRLLVVNDFTTNFVAASKEKAIGICPNGGYPEAMEQLNFTIASIRQTRPDIPMAISYMPFYKDGEDLNLDSCNREEFDNYAKRSAMVTFCFDGPGSGTLKYLMQQLKGIGRYYDVIVLFSAASQKEVDASLVPIADSTVIGVGLKGTDLSKAYPTTSLTLRNLDFPEMVACLIGLEYERINENGDYSNPVKECWRRNPAAQPPLRILITNDFSSAVISQNQGPLTNRKQSFVCPGNMYPEAGLQFDFSVDIVNGIRPDIAMEISYYPNNGEEYYDLDWNVYSRANFAYAWEGAYGTFCMDGPEDENFGSFVEYLSSYHNTFDVIVLITAAKQTDLDVFLPLSNAAQIVGVGLYYVSHASPASKYPDTSTTIMDFSPSSSARVACIINAVYDNLFLDSHNIPVKQCT